MYIYVYTYIYYQYICLYVYLYVGDALTGSREGAPLLAMPLSCVLPRSTSLMISSGSSGEEEEGEAPLATRTDRTCYIIPIDRYRTTAP